MTTAKAKEETQKFILVSGTYAKRVGSGEGKLRIWHAGEEIKLTESEANTMRDKIMTPEKFQLKISEFEEQATEEEKEKQRIEALEEGDELADPEAELRRLVILGMNDKRDATRRIM